LTEDLGKITGFEGIELSAAPGNSITIDGVTIRDNMIAVCKGDADGLLSVKYLKKSCVIHIQPKVKDEN